MITLLGLICHYSLWCCVDSWFVTPFEVVLFLAMLVNKLYLHMIWLATVWYQYMLFDFHTAVQGFVSLNANQMFL